MDKSYNDKEKLIILKALSDISNKKESYFKIVLKKAKKKKVIPIKFWNLLKKQKAQNKISGLKSLKFYVISYTQMVF